MLTHTMTIRHVHGRSCPSCSNDLRCEQTLQEADDMQPL